MGAFVILELNYVSIIGPGVAYYTPANPAIANAYGLELALTEGETSESRADEAAAQLCADILRFGGLAYEPAAHNPPSPPPSTPPDIEQKYLQRAVAVPRVMARWAALNEAKLLAYVAPTVGGETVNEPDPADYEDDEEGYQAALDLFLSVYDPDLHGWAPRMFSGFMHKVGPVVILLQSLAFGATAAAVSAFSDVLATPTAKQAYLDIMASEGALPQ